MGSGVSVNQPPSGGSDYPFVRPSADVAGLLGDLFLAYREGSPPFRRPFSVKWLHGFGSGPSAPLAGAPAPSHYRDLVVSDADGRTVFDSTGATSFRVTPWSSLPREVVSWEGPGGACRCTAFTASRSSFPADLHPDSAVLEARAASPAPAGLAGFLVGDALVSGAVRFASGFNVAVTPGKSPGVVSTVPPAPGLAPASTADFTAAPGLGLGQAPGCPGGPLPVASLAGAAPSASGNLTLDLADCLRVEYPVRVVGPYGARVAKPQPGGLVLRNDCDPCCPCSGFVRAYKGLTKLWYDGAALASSAAGARDALAANKARWEEQKRLKEANALRPAVVPTSACRATAGAVFCNTLGVCLNPVLVRVTLQVYSAGGDVTAGAGGRACAPIYVQTKDTCGEQAYAPSGSWPVYDFYFDNIDPGTTARLRFRVCDLVCSSPTSLRATVTLHTTFPGIDPGAHLHPAEGVPDDVLAYWPFVPELPVVFFAQKTSPLQR